MNDRPNAHRPPPAATLIAAGLVTAFFVQGVFFIRANSQTYDEAAHLVAGYSYLVTGDFRLHSEHPPLLRQLQALPLLLAYRIPFGPEAERWRKREAYLIGLDFLYRSEIPAERLLFAARLVTLALGAVLILAVGWWAHRLWGVRAALLAIAIACFEPNLIAHSSLVTNDVGVSLFVFLTVYLLWEHAKSPSWKALVAAGLCAGAAFASKYSGLLLIPILFAISLLPWMAGRPLLLPSDRNPRDRRVTAWGSARVLSILLGLALLAIPPVYFFAETATFLSGLELQWSITSAGRPAFFLGDHSYGGWWNYFLVAFLIKTPIGALALILASLALYRWGSPLRTRELIFLLAPVAIFFAAATQSRLDVGLRHILPVYPFLLVLASRLATVPHRPVGLLLGAALLSAAVSSLRVAPHQLAYFNELVGGPERGYLYLSDSNLDWGQDLKGVKSYMDREKLPVIYLSYFGTAPPGYYGIRYQYVPGTWPLEWPPPPDRVAPELPRKVLAISAYNLQDVSRPHDPLFRWLRRREPVAQIGYSILVYDLTNDPEGLRLLEETYRKAGIPGPDRAIGEESPARTR